MPHPSHAVLLQDPDLAKIIVGHPDPGYVKTDDPFATLVSSVIGQQLSSRVATTIEGRFCALFCGEKIPTAEEILAANPDEMRACGLSWAKVRTIQGVADAVIKGELEINRLDELDDETIREEIVKIKGLGVWSADMFLMFALARPDVLPLGDLAIRKAMMRLMGRDVEPKHPELVERAEPWRPFRSAACWYLWRTSDPV